MGVITGEGIGNMLSMKLLEERIRCLDDERLIREIENGPNSFQKGVFPLYLKIAYEKGIKICFNEELNLYYYENETDYSNISYNIINEIIWKGRMNLRLIIPYIILAMFSSMLIFYGVIQFIPVLLISLFAICSSFPMDIILNEESISQRNIFNQEMLIKWTNILNVHEQEINHWKGSLNIIINIFFFGWVSLLLYRNKFNVITITYSEYQEFNISSYSIKNYDNLREYIFWNINNKKND